MSLACYVVKCVKVAESLVSLASYSSLSASPDCIAKVIVGVAVQTDMISSLVASTIKGLFGYCS